MRWLADFSLNASMSARLIVKSVERVSVGSSVASTVRPSEFSIMGAGFSPVWVSLTDGPEEQATKIRIATICVQLNQNLKIMSGVDLVYLFYWARDTCFGLYLRFC